MLLTALCCQANAQETVYHGDSCYLFNPSFETCIKFNYQDTCAYRRHNGLWTSVQEYTVSQPTLVYGIAVTGTVVTLAGNSHTVAGLDTGVYYAARVRTQCRHSCPIHTDTVVWSGWGAPTLFYLGSEEPDTNRLGIRQAAPVEWSLTPNPARGTATVRCDGGMASVVLLSVKGDIVQRRELAGAEVCTLDLADLARGIYIVSIATPQGTAAQKLAVE